MSEKETVPLDSIGKADLPSPPKEPPLPRGTDPFTGKGGTFDKELGWIGRIVGGNTEKSGNIAFVVIVLCLILVVAIFLWAFDQEKGGIADSVWNLISLLGSLASACIGFIFGDKNRPTNGS